MAKKATTRKSTVKMECPNCKSTANFTWMDGKNYRCVVCGKIVTKK